MTTKKIRFAPHIEIIKSSKPKFSIMHVLRSIALFFFDLTSIIAFCCIFLSGLLIVWSPDTVQAGKIFISVLIFNIFLWFWASVFDR